jgi:hypothetical protein
MADIVRNIESERACLHGPRDSYVRIYYVDPAQENGTELAQLQLEAGEVPSDIMPAAIIRAMAARLNATLDLELAATDIVGACLMQECRSREHDGQTRNPRGLPRLERYGSFIVAGSVDDLEAIEPLRLNEQPDIHGYGTARRVLKNTVPIDPLIHLSSVTRYERKKYPLEHAVLALAARGRANDPHVALHGEPGDVEKIVTASQLH